MDDGKLLVGTAANLFLVSTRDLDVVGNFDTEFDLVGREDGFQQTVGAASGALAYVTDDRAPVRGPRQRRQAGDRSASVRAGRGERRRPWRRRRPARDLARLVAFGGPDGVFVYRAAAPRRLRSTTPRRRLASRARQPARGCAARRRCRRSRATTAGSPPCASWPASACSAPTPRAPYECAFRPTAGDVGRTTLVAVATDGAGQTAVALRTATVARFTPRGLSAKTTRRGLRFTTRGVLRMPAGVTRRQGCAPAWCPSRSRRSARRSRRAARS